MELVTSPQDEVNLERCNCNSIDRNRLSTVVIGDEVIP